MPKRQEMKWIGARRHQIFHQQRRDVSDSFAMTVKSAMNRTGLTGPGKKKMGENLSKRGAGKKQGRSVFI